MRFSTPIGLVALIIAAALYAAHQWRPALGFVAVAVLACLAALIRLTQANGEIPRQELFGLAALLLGLMGAMASVLFL